MELSTLLSQPQIELLEDYVGIEDLKRYPCECIHDRLKGKYFWTDHEYIILFRGNLSFAKTFLFFIGWENPFPELKVGDLWMFIDDRRIEVIDRLIRQWEQKQKNEVKP